jgi:hypothetical protein
MQRGEDAMAIEHMDTMEHNGIGARVVAQRSRRVSLDEKRSDHKSMAELRHQAAAVVERAGEAIGDDPERAARLLDEALLRVIALWLAWHGQEVGPNADGPALIESRDRHVARQLRLARRASDPRSGLRHARAMLVLVERVEPGLEPLDAGCGTLAPEDPAAQADSRLSDCDEARGA